MTAKIATEHQEQVALFQWARLARVKYAPLTFMFAIPNGGLRDTIVAQKMKAEGVKAGVPDIFLPRACGGYHGLFIELKRRKLARISPEQKVWMNILRRAGYRVEVAFGWEHARDIIIEYLES